MDLLTINVVKTIFVRKISQQSTVNNRQSAINNWQSLKKANKNQTIKTQWQLVLET